MYRREYISCIANLLNKRLEKELAECTELCVQFEKRNSSGQYKMNGLVPVIVQDYWTRDVLTLAYTNREALDETVRSGRATFWSTSRNELWKKGETSGNYLPIRDILIDCDQDAIVYIVDALAKDACHTKRKSCFYRRLTNGSLEFIQNNCIGGRL